MQNNSHLSNIASLVSDCIIAGITHVVISPGSRNAPLTILFSSSEAIDLHVVVDERSAGFYALGMAQQLQQPVAIVCTSGTASLNYAPAIAEAYYLQVPLLVLTADRPLKWLHHSEGQQINQTGIYDNFSSASFTYDSEFSTEHLKKTTSKAFKVLADTSRPVHINIPLDEPLYRLEAFYPVLTTSGKWNASRAEPAMDLTTQEFSLLSKNILIAIGCSLPDDGLNNVVAHLSKKTNVAVITETTSNLTGTDLVRNPDLVLASLDKDSKEELRADLLITVGTHFISKHLKTFLRQHKPSEHWHINANGYFPDTFEALTKCFYGSPAHALKVISKHMEDVDSEYFMRWKSVKDKISAGIRIHINNQPWSELEAFYQVHQSLPEGSALHLGNSLSVRYSQYIVSRQDITYLSNRGTSGIDGSLSTAVGSAMVSDKLHTIVLGDLSFMYDSNALWKENLPDNLRIIILNNGGGGIFRFINGPGNFKGFERTFIARHNMTFEHTANQFNVSYGLVQNENELINALDGFYSDAGIQMLEIKTNEEENNKILKSYIHKIIDEL